MGVPRLITHYITMNKASVPAPAPAPAPSRGTSSRSASAQQNTRTSRASQRHSHEEREERRPTSGPRRRSASRGDFRPGSVTRRIQRILRRPGAGGSPRTGRTPDYYPEAPGPDVSRVIPLGGSEEVGRNMIAIDVNGDIIVMDAGFHFKDEEGLSGIDYTLPNTRFLEKNKERVRAVIITHGHLDHIGGIPFILPRFGNPPIYTRRVTSIMIQKRQEEYPDIPAPQIHEVDVGQTVTLGNTRVTFFPVTHSIPDSMGVSIETPHGNIVVTGDLKLEHEDGVPSATEQKTWSTIGKNKNIFFIADSTNAEKEGFSIPESHVLTNLDEIIKNVKSRLIVGIFASQFERMINLIQSAQKYGKKVILEGRSIKNNIEIAERAGLLTVDKGTIIQAQDIKDYPPDKIVVFATGAQGEEFAALMRIATKQHKYIQFTERDTVVLSSSVIPGNEISVQKLKDNLYRNDLTIIHYRSSDVHSSGHGNQGELVWINQQVGAKFFMPSYGYRSMTTCHARAVSVAGFPRENIIIPDNGIVIDIVKGEEMIVHKQKVPSTPLVVDGFTIGDVQEVVIRDRQSLAKDGMFVIIASVALKTGKLRKSPDIISRGFVYLRESQPLLNEARVLIKKTIEDATRNMNPIDLDYVKNAVTDVMASFLFSRTNKAPMVIPVLIGM